MRVAAPERRAAAALAAAAVALAAALAAPSANVDRRVFDGVVVFDITQSMNTLDYTLGGRPASRLAFAKARARAALAELPCGSRVGWGVFTEYRSYFLLMPTEVCANYGDLAAALDRIDGGMAWAGGSQVAKGLYSALRIAAAAPSRPAIAFISDGHEAPPPEPGFLQPFQGTPGAVRGVVIGAGGPLARPIPKFDPFGRPLGEWAREDVVQTPSGNEHLSSRHEAYLKTLASVTGLAYRSLDQDGDLAAMLMDEQATRRETARMPLRVPAAALALGLTLAAIDPRRRWPARRLVRS
ncbi:MAG TPA: MxaL protein [Burkholderiaceae bacterium]